MFQNLTHTIVSRWKLNFILIPEMFYINQLGAKVFFNASCEIASPCAVSPYGDCPPKQNAYLRVRTIDAHLEEWYVSYYLAIRYKTYIY